MLAPSSSGQRARLSVCNHRGLGVPRTLERNERFQIAFAVRRGGNAIGRDNHHGPVTAVAPCAFEQRERHPPAARLARAQHETARARVVAHGSRVVPAVERTGTVILKHDDGRARRDLAQQVFEARRERVGDHSISARSGKHLHLHAAFALRYVDLPYEVVRRDAHLEMRKRRRERGRPH